MRKRRVERGGLGERIERAMEDADLTPAKLGAACFASEPTVYRWIAGTSRPSARRLRLIEKVTRTRLEDQHG